MVSHVKEHVPEAHMPGVTVQPCTEFVTVMLSMDMNLLSKNLKGIMNLN